MYVTGNTSVLLGYLYFLYVDDVRTSLETPLYYRDVFTFYFYFVSSSYLYFISSFQGPKVVQRYRRFVRYCTENTNQRVNAVGEIIGVCCEDHKCGTGTRCEFFGVLLQQMLCHLNSALCISVLLESSRTVNSDRVAKVDLAG
jgi:hypothetical protein